MNQPKLCEHTKHDGTPCQAIALTDSKFCYFHRCYYKAPALPGDRTYKVPLLESHHSIQIAVTDLYQSFLEGKIGYKEARFALQLLRLASKTIAEIERNSKENTTGASPVGLSAVVPGAVSGVPEGVPGPFPPLERAGSAVPNPFVNPKPPQSEKSYKDRYIDPYGCLAPLVKKEKEAAGK